jgi:hypothetical protein
VAFAAITFDPAYFALFAPTAALVLDGADAA